MFGSRFVNLGSAQASVTIDLSQAQASVATMRSIAQQIAQSVAAANQSIASVNQQPAQAQSGGAAASPYGMSAQQLTQINQQAAQFSQNQVAAQQQITQAVQATAQARNQNVNAFEKEFAIANAMVGVLRTQVAEQANLYRTSTANAPSTVDRSGVEQQLRAARQPIVEIQAQLAQLRAEYLQATSPQQQAALVPQLQAIQQAAAQAANGMQPLAAAVSNFSQQVVSSRSGVDGYFNSVRENLEKINETSLAANLQEISFRLLPLGIAAAGLTKQGLETAEAIQESAISFTAFTGSQEKARQLMSELTDQAHKFGQPMIETLTTMQRFAPLIRNAGLQLDDVYNIAVRLSTLNPTQGIEGSLYAINEAVAGQWRSIQTRFNLPTKELKEFIDQFGFTEGFDKFLNKIGRSTEFAQQFGQTTRASFTRMQELINNFLSTSMDKFIGGMTAGADTATSFFNSLAEGNSILTTITGGVLLLTSTLTTGLITLGQFALAWTSIGAVAKPFFDPKSSAGQFAVQVASSLSNTIPASVLSAFTSITSALSALIAGAVRVGIEVGTASANVFRGAASKVAEAVGSASTSIAGAIAAAIPASVISAFISAKVAIASSLSSIVATASALIVPLLTGAVVTGVALAIGGAIGIGISQHLVNILKVGTPTYREQLWQDPIGTLVDTFKKNLFLLASVLTVGVAALRTAFAPVTVALEQARDMLSTAVGKLSESIRTAGENLILGIIDFVQGLGGAFSNVGNESKQAIESRRNAPSRFDLTDPGMPGVVQMSLPYGGLESGTKEQIQALAEIQKMFPAWTAEFVEGYKEQNDRLDKVLARGFFADPARIAELNRAIAGQAFNALKALFFEMWPSAAPTSDAGMGGAPPIDQQALDDALKVINQIAVAERDYALQQKRTLEDRALAAAREVADVALANQRRAADFTLQQSRALDDYYRSRQQSIDDFDRQTVEAQKQADEQRAKMQADYNTQSLRAEQDHLRDMIRLSRDITDAISARDFLSAQKTVQRMQDQEADYQTEKARRDEDFQKQLADLQENLVKQQAKRKEDFDRQLALQEANFNLQRQRQVADYNRQAVLADQDRQLRLARQAQDFAIQEQRRHEDFARQIQEMVSNNAILNGIWVSGLHQIDVTSQNFLQSLLNKFTAIGLAANSVFSNIGSSIGNIIGNILGTNTSDLGTGTLFPNVGTAFSQDVSWFTPSTMQTSGVGAMLPGSIISGGRRSAGGGDSGGGNTYQVSVPLQVINGAGLNENQLVDRVEKIIIPKIAEALEQQARTTQPRRGFS